MTAITPMTGSYKGCTQESGLSITVNTNNQISTSGFSHDSAGGLLGDGTNSYTYDGKSELLTAATGSGLFCYTYDGSGRRVAKAQAQSGYTCTSASPNAPTISKLYWYDAGGNVLDETDGSGNLSDEYVFFGGKRIARRTGSSGGSTSATFVGSDTSTGGSWHGVYGGDGYSISQDSQSIPSYASFSVSGESNYTWASSTTDTRALQNGANTYRLAACWYNNSPFSFDINITDGNSHQVGLYALDWDSGARAETIQVLDASTSAVLDSRSITSFVNGVYLLWNISGHVTITVTYSGGTNAVVSGVFFNGGSSGTSVSYYLADQLGSARVVTDASGTVLDNSDFYPYGGERAISSSSGNTYKFTGKERDSESGLDNFWREVRLLPVRHRFMSTGSATEQRSAGRSADLESVRLCPKQPIGHRRSDRTLQFGQHLRPR